MASKQEHFHISAICPMKSTLKIKYVETRAEVVVHAWADHSKFYKILKPRKQTNLDIGIEKMAKWLN